LIAIAELLIFFDHFFLGATIHAINLVALVLSAAYVRSRTYPVLMLLPIFRLVNLGMPVFFNFSILYYIPMIYAPMLLPICLMIKEGSLSRDELGLTLRGFHYYMPLGIAVGMLLGWVEYNILHPLVLFPAEGIAGFLVFSLIMMFFVGFVEEFIYRSALQTAFSKKLGSLKGLAISSLIFALMYGVYHLTSEMIFIFFAGLTFGVLFMKTSSLPFIALAHGITNITLFLIVPLYSVFILPIVVISLILGGIFALRSKALIFGNDSLRRGESK
jgi:membrane protease YdiL (CAAX protease family)